MSQTAGGRCLDGHDHARSPKEETCASTFRVPKAEITGAYGKVMTTYARRTSARSPTTLYVLWHNRKALKAVFELEQEVAKWDGSTRT